MKLQTGDIFFWYSTSDLFGKAINYYNKKTLGNSNTTHCGIISKIEKDKVLIHEAGPNGFLPSEYDISWLESNNNVHIGRLKEPMNNVFETCEKYRGIRYGWLDIAGIMLNYLIGWKVLGVSGKNAIICSEAVSRIIYDCTKNINKNYLNLNGELDVNLDKITPAHIFYHNRWIFYNVIKI